MENKPLTFNKVSVPKSRKRSNLTYLLDTGEDPSPIIIPEPLEDKKSEKDEVKEPKPTVVNKPKTTVVKSEKSTIIDPKTQSIVNNTGIFSRRRYWDPDSHQDYLNKQKKNNEKEDEKKSKSKSSKQLCYLECDRLYKMARMKSKKRKHKKKKNTKKYKKKQTKKHS